MTTNGFKTAADLFAKKERRYIEVDGYRLRSLTAVEMRRLRASLSDDKGNLNERAERIPELLTIHCLCDKDGKPILQEAELAEFDGLDAAVVNTLGRAAVDHTGWAADYDAEAISTAVGNSEETD